MTVLLELFGVGVFLLQDFLLVFILRTLQLVIPVVVEILVLLDVRCLALLALLLVVVEQLLHLEVELLFSQLCHSVFSHFSL